MNKYQLKLGSTTTDVVETIRDIQVLFKDNQPVEIQVWLGRDYSLNGEKFKSDAPVCTVLKLTDERQIGETEFGNTGITLLQALTILGVIGSATTPDPINAVGSVTRPTIPDGIGAKLSQLTSTKTSLESEIDSLNSSRSSAATTISQLQQQISSLQARKSELESNLNEAVKAREEKVEELQNTIASLEETLAQKADSIKSLDEALRSKSDASTAATTELDGTLRRLQLADRAEALPEYIKEQQKQLQQVEDQIARRQEEVATAIRIKQEELQSIEEDIAERKAELSKLNPNA